MKGLNQKSVLSGLFVVLFCCGGLLSCSGLNNLPAKPATIVEHSPQSLAELHEVLQKALNLSQVLIADDALTESYRLVIEESPPSLANGQNLSGRIMTPPEIFELYVRGDSCFLLHTNQQKQWKLQLSECKVL